MRRRRPRPTTAHELVLNRLSEANRAVNRLSNTSDRLGDVHSKLQQIKVGMRRRPRPIREAEISGVYNGPKVKRFNSHEQLQPTRRKPLQEQRTERTTRRRVPAREQPSEEYMKLEERIVGEAPPKVDPVSSGMSYISEEPPPHVLEALGEYEGLTPEQLEEIEKEAIADMNSPIEESDVVDTMAPDTTLDEDLDIPGKSTSY
jgi:hypothetical protein